jgi:hypothetical protein
MYNWKQKDRLQFQYNANEFTAIALNFTALLGEIKDTLKVFLCQWKAITRLNLKLIPIKKY